MLLFKDYIKKFDLENPMIKLKYHHSLRVQGICNLLAIELDFNEEDQMLASLCGIYHDLGRFKQAKIYNSFKDLETVDHGELGYKEYLRFIAPKVDMPKNDETIIAKVALFHSKLKIPKSVTERQKMFIDLVRDADKIDILYQMAHIKGMLYDDGSEISPEIVAAFKKKESIDKRLIKTHNDENIVTLAYVFDLNYKASFKIIADNNFLEYMQKILKDEKFDSYFKAVNKMIKESK